ncbi:hypothetical protein [Pedobacter frigoris]|uniref:glycoside hydrolase family 38 N-terminal domain-containing protein n=1 Tax=Pedobacter frigoris TaxID=2571272 RepID=UPI002931F4A9|nr:hypothetical protein [Pedobacter frigoris]
MIPKFLTLSLMVGFLPAYLFGQDSMPKVKQQKVKNTTKVTDIWVVFKTHFDLGFTDLPENVFTRYREEMMDKALSVIEKNANLSKEKQFAWTVPGWPLKAQILGPLQSPERKLRIEKAIKSGAIVVHGLPFTTHTESLEYEDLVRGLGFSSQVARSYGLPLPISAKMTDVPSHSWVLPTLLNNAGIKFLQLGCNPASQYPRFPSLFWWEGPDGSKILCQYSPLYGSDIKPIENWPSKNYLAMQMTGDNHGPPSQEDINKLLDYAERELPGVKIHFGTLDDFAKALIAENPKLETVKGDTPDTWIHGLLSAPQGAGIARSIRPLEPVLDALHTQMKVWNIPGASISGKLAEAYENSLLYSEHTWGMNAEYGPRYAYGDEWKKWMREAEAEPVAANGDYSKLKNSNSTNTGQGSKRKWLNSYDKHQQYIRNTSDIISAELNSHLNLLAKSVNIKGKRFVVYNPLPWKRSGMVENPLKKGDYFFVEGIEPLSYISYTQNQLKDLTTTNDGKSILSTPYFNVVFDLTRGGISSLIDKKTGRELVDKSSKYIVGQFLHERFSTNEVDKWFNAYSRIKTGWGLNDLGKPGMINAEKAPYLTFTPDEWKIAVSHTEIADVATLTAVDTKGYAKSYSIVFTFPRKLNYFDTEWFVDGKTAEKQPEGGWLCFPFAVQNPNFTIGRLGGPVNPATDIIDGTNRYLMAVNSGVSITSADQSGLALTPLSSPLVSMGEPGLWRFSMDYIPKVSSVFVNIYNNMWNTNFQLWQEGSWSEKVRVWTVGQQTPTVPDLVQKSWEARLPLLTGTADGEAGKLPAKMNGLSISRSGVLLTAFGENPDGEGTILRVWEQAGNSGMLKITLPKGMKVSRAIAVNLRGEQMPGGAKKVVNGQFSFVLNKYAPASFVLE